MSAKLRLIGMLLCIAAVSATGIVTAQAQRRGGQRPGAARDRAVQRDPEAMRQRMMQRMQQQLGASEAEWQVIQPRLLKVMELSRQAERRGPSAMGARPGAGRRPGQDRAAQEGQRQRGQMRRPRGEANRPVSEVQKASDELRALLGSESATPEQVKAKLTALREARAAARQKLAQARADLQQVLTVKQEARLVLMGLLE